MAHKTSPQRILSIAFPHLPTDHIARRKWGKSWILNGRPDGPPIVVTDMVKNAIRIVAHEQNGARYGIRVDRTLSDTRAITPDLDCFTHDRDANFTLLKAVAAWCERYTPLVALDQNLINGWSLFMDITGCAPLFGGEVALMADLRARLKAQGFSIRLCLADTPGAAWAMAHFGTMQLISEGEHGSAIKDLPVAALRLEKETILGLNRVGLKTIGCIAEMPRAPLAARFGRELLQRLDQSLGVEDEVISPLMPVAELTSEKRFPDPIVYEDDIKQIIGLLAGNIIPLLEKRGLGARQCAIKLFRVDGNVSMLCVQSAKPLRDAEKIARLFYERIAGLHDDYDAGFGFDVIRLEILRADPFAFSQNDLIGGNHSAENYDSLIDRLGARLGTDCVQHIVLADTHIPERSFGMLPVAQSASDNRSSSAFAEATQIATECVTRPLTLLRNPEPVEVMAQVPEGAPVRFRWRKVSYDIAKSEGPERIACEWWHDGRSAYSRDYYRVEDKHGYRFWVFRHGLYDRETNNPRWYMHGMFA